MVAEDCEFVYKGEQDQQVHTVVDYCFGMRTLGVAYAKAGIHEVPGRHGVAKNVVYEPLDSSRIC